MIGKPERARDPWRPVLLSTVLFPGAGQLATGHPWRALAYGGGSLALIIVLLRRVYRATVALLPTDPDRLLDPGLPLRLTHDLYLANSSFFFWMTLALAVLWLASILDAARGVRS